MSSFISFIALCALVCIGLSNAVEMASADKMITAVRAHLKPRTHPRGSRTQSIPSNLRKIEDKSVTVLASSNQYVKEKGYFEEAYYAGTSPSNSMKCVSPQYKYVYVLNTCVVSSEPGVWYIDMAYADPQGNTYYLYEQEYLDSACTMTSGSPFLLYQSYILICEDLEDPSPDDDFFYNDHSLFHTIAEPLNPTTDTMGVSYLNYNTQANCQTNNYAMGVFESAYYHLNECFPASTGSSGYDFMFTSCSTTGLMMSTFTSTDGKCTGTSTPSTSTQADMCMGTSASPFLYASGWLNFGCTGMSS
jgi:hypothetical protein